MFVFKNIQKTHGGRGGRGDLSPGGWWWGHWERQLGWFKRAGNWVPAIWEKICQQGPCLTTPRGPLWPLRRG